jgi:hypothetical protein
LLFVEGLLWLSERMQWPTWHKGYAVLTAVGSLGVVFVVMLLWFIVALVFRWRFQFSIRSLLVLTATVALPCSWLAVEMRAARRQREAVAVIKNCGGSVEYDWEYHWSPSMAGPRCRDWLHEYGDDFFNDVVFVVGVSDDAQMEYLKGLPNVEFLDLDDTQITDTGLRQLAGLTQLRVLSLRHTKTTDEGLTGIVRLPRLERLVLDDTGITDAGVKQLSRVPQLQGLSLDNTLVTDAGMAPLAGMTHLEGLWLDKTQITDAGLVHLKGLSRLLTMYLVETRVTKEGVADLQKALPNCFISVGQQTRPRNPRSGL